MRGVALLKKLSAYTFFMGLVLLADAGLTLLSTIPIFLIGLLLPLFAVYGLTALLLYKNFSLVQRSTPEKSFWGAISRVGLAHNLLTLVFCLLYLAFKASDHDSLVVPGILFMYLTLRFSGGAILATAASAAGLLVKAATPHKKRFLISTLVGLVALSTYVAGFQIDGVPSEGDAQFVIRIVQTVCTFGSLSVTCFLTFLFGKSPQPSE